MDGIVFALHAACLRLDFPNPLPELLPRISDPVAEPELVTVEWTDLGWSADCLIHGAVGLKDVREDAHLAAARHIANKHGFGPGNLQEALSASLEAIR